MQTPQAVLQKLKQSFETPIESEWREQPSSLGKIIYLNKLPQRKDIKQESEMSRSNRSYRMIVSTYDLHNSYQKKKCTTKKLLCSRS